MILTAFWFIFLMLNRKDVKLLGCKSVHLFFIERNKRLHELTTLQLNKK